MTYPPATIARRLACGVCPLCDDPGKPVAARSGVAHEHAGLLCLEHLLDALGMPLERPRPAIEPPDPAPIRAAFRATLRVPSEANAAPTAVTLARQAPPTPLEPELLGAALECMRQLGAVPLRTEPTYGVPCGMGCPWKPLADDAPPRDYDPGQTVAWASSVDGYEWLQTGEPGLPVELDDEAMPSGARTIARAALKAAWTVRIMAGPKTTILRCDRGGLLVVARYEKGRYRAGWVRMGRGQPVACAVKQVAAILKAGG